MSAKNTLLVVDVFNIMRNLLHAFGDGNSKLNYAKFVESAVGPDDILFKAIAYGIEEERNRKFIKLLKSQKFDISFKKPTTRIDFETKQEVPFRIGPNVDITIDVMQLVSTGKIERVILGSSDTQFIRLAEEVKKQGIIFDVYSSRIPHVLKQVASTHTEITKELLLKADSNGQEINGQDHSGSGSEVAG